MAGVRTHDDVRDGSPRFSNDSSNDEWQFLVADIYRRTIGTSVCPVDMAITKRKNGFLQIYIL